MFTSPRDLGKLCTKVNFLVQLNLVHRKIDIKIFTHYKKYSEPKLGEPQIVESKLGLPNFVYLNTKFT